MFARDIAYRPKKLLDLGSMHRVFGNQSTPRIGAPVRHYSRSNVGVVQSYYFEGGRLYYVVDWLSEGISSNIPADAVVELPSEMHLLALA